MNDGFGFELGVGRFRKSRQVHHLVDERVDRERARAIIGRRFHDQVPDTLIQLENRSVRRRGNRKRLVDDGTDEEANLPLGKLKGVGVGRKLGIKEM